VKLDLLLDPFGARWEDMRAATVLAEESGFGGVWVWDHLAGSTHRAPHVLECWTVVTALAAVTERVMLGPLVLNNANRDPAMVAIMAATLQEVSGGRLLLGLGAGGNLSTPYGAEQVAFGRSVAADPVRRRALEDGVATIRSVWTGSHGGSSGYLVPRPPPPIVIGAFGPKTAELAGRVADGLNVMLGMLELVDVARAARRDAGLDPSDLLVTLNADLSPDSLAMCRAAGADRAICYLPVPYDLDLIRSAGRLLQE
jgi:alkanesulfonate monooxygenase SsuD/methylene tetrahydromethanopterin reductase-like flavin-dependent oxidoreductase (luciferase family)